MKSPWKSFGPLEPDREYLVFASSIPVRSRSATWRMFRGASAVRTQFATTEGVLGFALLARPWKKQYATLSIWTGEEALAAFVGHQPHRDLMAALAPEMGPTRFVRWTISGAEPRPSWSDALARLGAAP